MPNIIRESIRPQHFESPFTYSCRRNEQVVQRSLSTNEKCVIFIAALFVSPLVFFVGGIPVFFVLCAGAKMRHEGYVYIPRARQIRIPVGEGLGVSVSVPRNGRRGRNVFLRTFLGGNRSEARPRQSPARHPAHGGPSSVREERRGPAGAAREQGGVSGGSRPARAGHGGAQHARPAQSRNARPIPQSVGNGRSGVSARRV